MHIVPKINSHSGDVHIVPKINSYNWLTKRRVANGPHSESCRWPPGELQMDPRRYAYGPHYRELQIVPTYNIPIFDRENIIFKRLESLETTAAVAIFLVAV